MDNRLLSQWTPPYTPQHNGVAERRNQTLLDMMRSMMGKVNIPKSLWGYALKIFVFILNRVPSKSVDVTSYEMWAKKKTLSFSHESMGLSCLYKADYVRQARS